MGASPAGGQGKREPEIVVMPEKYYGMAAKMEGKTQAELETMAAKKAAPPPAPKPPIPAGPPHRRSLWPFILLFVLVVSLIGGGFVWFNREALFQPQTPPVVTEPTPEPRLAPNAPANLTATVTTGTSPAVSLSWVDGGGESTGFRVERREGEGTFLPLTPLPASSVSFLDVTVRTGRSYQYRVFSVGPGGESSQSNVAFVRIEAGTPIPVAPTLPPGGLDSDSDGLSDIEEAVFGTDARAPDSDRDGFLDGNEVFHLYNPAAAAPVRLLDSGLVVPFVSPAGWSLYVPRGWTATLDENDGSRATIRTGQGEVFRVTIADNPNELSLTDWYIAGHPGIAPSQLRAILTKGGLEGLLGPDRLDAHFAWDGKILILTYDLASRPFIQFRTTYEMLLNSLRLSGVPVLSESEAPALDGPGEFLSTTSTPTPSP
ncbi:MAG: fibronectin type III domain-containing protein [Candidatus Uhrbacteria bacterium]|nr:fibronectin type III domain-containing protein [Candidatus Uhrbacteria bacterium]